MLFYKSSKDNVRGGLIVSFRGSPAPPVLGCSIVHKLLFGSSSPLRPGPAALLMMRVDSFELGVFGVCSALLVPFWGGQHVCGANRVLSLVEGGRIEWLPRRASG